jgi:TIM-barrel protein
MINLYHPSVLAAMAGRNDGLFCKKIGDMGVGMVTIGGISVDEKTLKASQKMVQRGRKEFLCDNIQKFLEDTILQAQKSPAAVCVNIRSSTIQGYLDAGQIIADLKGIVEVNAHCRQKEIMAVKAGQYLLHDFPKLKRICTELEDIGIAPIIKFRGNVIPEHDILTTVNPKAVHIDSYKEGEKGFDFTVFEKIIDFDCFKIGNNSVNTPDVARKVLKVCDAFSFAQVAWNKKAVRALANVK